LIVDTYVSGIADTGAFNMLDRNTVALPPPIEADQIAVIAKAMAHPARVRIIAFLLSKPGCIGGDIVDEVGLAQSTVSEHLRILKDAGIVTGTIDYPRVCYALDPSALAPIRDLIEAIAARSPEGEAPCCYTPQGCVPKETAK
jgi:DNA-binding transcriptional ArsR family regulator